MTPRARWPRPLRPGDRVAVVAPSSPVFPAPLDQGLAVLRSWGLDVVEGAHLRSRAGYLAAPDADRGDDLDAAFRDPSVRAVFAGRGGYGVQRIVDGLDWDALAADPILLIGFSDITALLHAAWGRLRLVGVHGPFAGRLHLQSSEAAAALRALLFGAMPDDLTFRPQQVITPGVACGPLLGGNLSLLCAGVGTPDELDVAGAVLVLEDVGEAPYAIDRMLTHLRRRGMLAEVAGVVVGTCVRCDPPRDRPSAGIEEVVADRLGDLGVPVVAGLPIGHVDDQVPLLHGARVGLDTDVGRLHVAEPPERWKDAATP